MNWKLTTLVMLFCSIMHSQKNRIWSINERWFNLSGYEALLLAGLDSVSALKVPSYLKADGAIVWAINNDYLKFDHSTHLDTRNLVALLKHKLGNAVGPYSTTSPTDALLKDGMYNVYAWQDIKTGNTERFNLAPRVQSGGDKNLRTNHGRSYILSALLKMGGDRKVVRINREQFTGLPNDHSDRSNDNPSVLDFENGNIFPTMDKWKELQRQEFRHWAQFMCDGGIELEMVIIDTEVRIWQPHHVSNAEWKSIKESSKWPHLKKNLLKFGFDINQSTTANLNQRAVWNYVVNNRLNDAILYVLEGIREVFPKVIFSFYEQRGMTGRHWPYQSGWYIETGWGGPNDAGMNFDKGDVSSPAMYGLSSVLVAPWSTTYPKYSKNGQFLGKKDFDLKWRHPWDAFIADVSRLNGDISSRKTTLMPWIGNPDIFTKWYRNKPSNKYYKEVVFHCAVKGAEDFLLYNHDGNEDMDYLESILSEIDTILPYQKKRILEAEPISYGEKDYVVSGCDTGGRLIYRISWDSEVISRPEDQILWPKGKIFYDNNGIGAWVIDSSNLK